MGAVLAGALIIAARSGRAEENRRMEKPGFVVVDHMGGALAISLGRVESIFYLPAKEKEASLRFNLAGGDNKVVAGAAADAHWKSVRQGSHADEFLWVSHMGGTLGIPLRSIQSVFRSADGQSLRINYPGDPQGKTVQGAEAAEVWKRLSE
jgi:hypothetical protein